MDYQNRTSPYGRNMSLAINCKIFLLTNLNSRAICKEIVEGIDEKLSK